MRVYDQWSGNPKGIPEDPTCCVAEVVDFTGWHYYQCSRKRGYGPNGEYCKQHAKIIERRKSLSTKPLDASDGRRIPVESRSDSERDRPVG